MPLRLQATEDDVYHLMDLKEQYFIMTAICSVAEGISAYFFIYQNRHWAGHGKIMIDRRAVNEYLSLIGEKELPLNLFEVVDIEDRFPVKRVKELLNEKK